MVDDEPTLLDIGKRFLEHSGIITVDTASTPYSAIEKLKKAEYHVIVSDTTHFA
ncbi:MAG TPA: response regulator [Methanoregulaceae archaeon]|nr:response regulator [Methanoregulaceae archaeon]